MSVLVRNMLWKYSCVLQFNLKKKKKKGQEVQTKHEQNRFLLLTEVVTGKKIINKYQLIQDTTVFFLFKRVKL